jgi:predicted extracellular nuclease
MIRILSFKASALALALLAATAGALAADTPIYIIQGSGAVSPLVGTVVTTTGVVTRLTNNGFFLQDAAGDGDPATSDGIFVFTSSSPTVAVGQLIRLTGNVTEFDVSQATTNPAAEARPMTQLTGTSGITLLGSGVITPTPVTLPVPVADGLEPYEGMLVTLAGPLTVQQNFFQGRFGQITIAAGGRRETPTNRHRPLSPAALALADENARGSLLLDDGSSFQNPNPTPYLKLTTGEARAGDSIASVIGTIDFGLATSSAAGIVSYRIQPTVAPVFSASNPRPLQPPVLGGNVKVAAFNVLNYFTTFTDGTTAGGLAGQVCTQGGSTPSASLCRGASNLAEFNRQRVKIVEAIAAIDADAVGLIELQNNGTVAAQNLVDGLNAKVGAGTYAVVPDPVAGGGAGTDAIRLAMIYKPARLLPVGDASSDASTVHNRPPLAVTFAPANGERFTVIVNHFKSKSCTDAAGADLDQRDGQGCFNPTRLAQAQALRSFVAQRQAASGSNDVLVVGDLNAYAQEDPIFDLTSSGYVDQIGRFPVPGHSFVFDGNSGRLDHAIATPGLSAKVVSASFWAINADEASLRDYNQEFKAPRTCSGNPCPPDPFAPDVFRSSDHDPVLVGLSIFKTITASGPRGALFGSEGDDRLIGGTGANRMTGRGGINVYVYASLRDAGDTITDFVPGKDLLDLRTLLATLGWGGSDPVAEGVVRFTSLRGNTSVEIDTDGTGPAAPRALLTLQGLSPASLSSDRDLIVR